MPFFKHIVIAALATIAPTLVHAATISSNPTLAISNLTFSNFTCSVSLSGVAVTPSTCGQINVNTTTSPATGIEISSGFLAANGAFDDTVIDYHVASTSGISSVGLDFNGYFFGEAISSVTESVFSGTQMVGFAQVSCGAIGGCTRTDNISLNGSYSNLSIEKDINLTALPNSLSGASIIDQTFTATPEPSSLALLGSGLIGAALLRRKAKKAEPTV